VETSTTELVKESEYKTHSLPTTNLSFDPHLIFITSFHLKYHHPSISNSFKCSCHHKHALRCLPHLPFGRCTSLSISYQSPCSCQVLWVEELPQSARKGVLNHISRPREMLTSFPQFENANPGIPLVAGSTVGIYDDLMYNGNTNWIRSNTELTSLQDSLWSKSPLVPLPSESSPTLPTT